MGLTGSSFKPREIPGMFPAASSPYRFRKLKDKLLYVNLTVKKMCMDNF